MRLLEQKKAVELVKKHKIPVVKGLVAKSGSEAVKIAKKVGFPAAMKVDSKDIVHKSDAGCVVTGISSEDEALKAYDKIMKNARKKKAKVNGVLVQEMESGTELIIGMKRDIQFGPVMMFGIGGIFVEVFKDVTFRVAPISKKEAMGMIDEVKAKDILEGIRGRKPVNKDKVADVISKLSMLAVKNKKIMEIDLNPVMADEKGVRAIDVRVMMDE